MIIKTLALTFTVFVIVTNQINRPLFANCIIAGDYVPAACNVNGWQSYEDCTMAKGQTVIVLTDKECDNLYQQN